MLFSIFVRLAIMIYFAIYLYFCNWYTCRFLVAQEIFVYVYAICSWGIRYSSPTFHYLTPVVYWRMFILLGIFCKSNKLQSPLDRCDLRISDFFYTSISILHFPSLITRRKDQINRVNLTDFLYLCYFCILFVDVDISNAY